MPFGYEIDAAGPDLADPPMAPGTKMRNLIVWLGRFS